MKLKVYSDKTHFIRPFQELGSQRVEDGYIREIVFVGGRHKSVFLHRLLWERKFGTLPSGYVLICKDGDKSNPRPSNWFKARNGTQGRIRSQNNSEISSISDECKRAVLVSSALKQEVAFIEGVSHA